MCDGWHRLFWSHKMCLVMQCLEAYAILPVPEKCARVLRVHFHNVGFQRKHDFEISLNFFNQPVGQILQRWAVQDQFCQNPARASDKAHIPSLCRLRVLMSIALSSISIILLRRQDFPTLPIFRQQSQTTIESV